MSGWVGASWYFAAVMDAGLKMWGHKEFGRVLFLSRRHRSQPIDILVLLAKRPNFESCVTRSRHRAPVEQARLE